MKFEEIILPKALVEDAENTPVSLFKAKSWAHARTHPMEEQQNRLKRYREKVEKLKKIGAPEYIYEYELRAIAEIKSQTSAGMLVEIVLYETVEEIIGIIEANVEKASIITIRQWLATNMLKITSCLGLQKDDGEKDNALLIVSEFIADTIFERADLVYKHMSIPQIVEYSSARDLEEGEDGISTYFKEQNPAEALRKETQERLDDVENGEDPGIHDVFAGLKDHLLSVLREVLRYPPITSTAN